MKKNILIKFVDMPSEFNCRENYITKALQKDYNIIFQISLSFYFMVTLEHHLQPIWMQ